MKTTKSLFKLTMAAFVLVGMLACAKDDVAVNESQLEVRGPGSTTEFEQFKIKGDITLIVNRQSSGFSGGQSFRLTGQGTGLEQQFGEGAISLVLNVDGQSGYASGQVNYDFVQTGETFTFALSGYLSREPGSASSELSSRLLVGTGTSTFNNSSGQYGGGTTTLFGDIYNLMQRTNMFDAIIVTDARVHL
jgi:hypothetical protein